MSRFLHENGSLIVFLNTTAAAMASHHDNNPAADDNNSDNNNNNISNSNSNNHDNNSNNNGSHDNSSSDAEIFHKMMALTQETTVERTLDIFLALCFLGIAIVAAMRMHHARHQQQQQQQLRHHHQQQQQQHQQQHVGGGGGGGGGAGAAAISTASTASNSSSSSSSASSSSETHVVTAFYALIFMTSVLRALWFGIPNSVWQPSYTPLAVYAFDRMYPSWIGALLSQMFVTAGSLALLSIFILILVYWADILKKYFYPGARRSRPMATFVSLVMTLGALEGLNILLFLCGWYSTEGMILYDALVLAVVSMVCVCQITIFSQRFRTVLKTLGAINQVSTDAQVRRIIWITITGNLFFVTRALMETIFALFLITYWIDHHTVAKLFSHAWWDTYVLLKYTSEVAILALMLYILQSRFTTTNANATVTATGSSTFTTQQQQQQQQQNRRAQQQQQQKPLIVIGGAAGATTTETTPLIQSADV